MPEHTSEYYLQQVEKYLRREDTVLASAARMVSSRTGSEWRKSKTKDVVERVQAAAGLALAGPFIVIFKHIIHLEDGHDPTYVTKRMGKNGKVIEIEKIRTMVSDAENHAHEVNIHNGMSGMNTIRVLHRLAGGCGSMDLMNYRS